MNNERLLVLAGMLTEAKMEAKKKVAGVPTMFKPPKDFFTKPAGEIVKGLLSAGEKKAMARLKAGFKGNKDPKAMATYNKAQEMLAAKLGNMKEELEATAKRAGVIFEKKKHDMDMDGASDPEMDMGDDAPPADDNKSDDGDDKPKTKKKKKEGGEEEDPLPAIVHKIAKKAVGKDEEELETLIMKVYDAGHKDGVKDADDDGDDKPKKKKKSKSDDDSSDDADDAPSDDADDKPKKDSKGDMPSMYDHHKSMKNQSEGKSWADAYIITEKHHVKKKGKVVKKGSKKECQDYMDDNDGCTLHKGEPKKLDEMFMTEKHHVKKGKKVVKVGSKKECKDYCDDNKGCTLHKGEPEEA